MIFYILYKYCISTFCFYIIYFYTFYICIKYSSYFYCIFFLYLTILLQEAQRPQGSMWTSMIWILLLIVVFWLFFIRPQSKKAKEQQKFRDELKKGDKVITIGGFHGKITEVKENTVMVSLSPDIVVEIEKSALVQNASQVGGQG